MRTDHGKSMKAFAPSPRLQNKHRELVSSAAGMAASVCLRSVAVCLGPPVWFPPISAFGTHTFNHSGEADAKSHPESSPGRSKQQERNYSALGRGRHFLVAL